MPNKADQDTLARRVRAAWRARTCAASIAVGAQVYAYGAGVVMTVSLNAAWLSALPMIPLSMLAAWLAARSLKARARRDEAPSRMRRFACVLLALTLLLSAVFALTALSALSEQTLLPQARLIMIMLLALLFAALCALGGGTGVSRLCFALRFVIPVGMLALIVLCVPMRISGLFPILGAGKEPLLLSMACMTGALAPVLTLLLPPQEITPEQEKRCPPPGGWFFVWRIALGAACGALMLLALCMADGYEMISEVFGQRLRLVSSARPEASLTKTLLTLLQLCALGLCAAHLLAACEQALVSVCPKLVRCRAGLLLVVLLCAACLFVIVFFGAETALIAAPLLAVPALLLLLFGNRV